MLLVLTCSRSEDLIAHRCRTQVFTLVWQVDDFEGRNRLVFSYSVMQITALYFQLFAGIGHFIKRETREICLQQ